MWDVLINGEPRGFINPSQDIKQGDPLSPYLFLLCVEGLPNLLRKAKESQNLHGILSCLNGVCISHLLFANDNFIFCQATVEECQHPFICLGVMRQLQARQSIDRKHPSFLVETQDKKSKQTSRH